MHNALRLGGVTWALWLMGWLAVICTLLVVACVIAGAAKPTPTQRHHSDEQQEDTWPSESDRPA